MNKDKVKQYFDDVAPTWKNDVTEEQLNYLLSFIPLKEGMKVLDLGCGSGIISERLYQITKTKVVGIDISKKMIDKAILNNDSSHIEFIAQDYYDYNDEKFDAIVCYNAYPHFLDVEEFINKSIKLLNNQGILAIIHSLSRSELSKCHKNVPCEVSRVLKPLTDEVKPYLNNFEVLELRDESIIAIVLRKVR